MIERFEKAAFEFCDDGEIESRVCHSDNYKGVEYRFSGSYIRIIPILEEVREMPNMVIETVSRDESGDVLVFVAHVDPVDPEGSALVSDL